MILYFWEWIERIGGIFNTGRRRNLNKNDLYQSFSNQSPVGMIVLDIVSPYTVRYMNEVNCHLCP